VSGWEWQEDSERRRYYEEQARDRKIDEEKEFERWVRELTKDPTYEDWLILLSTQQETNMPRVSEMIQSKFLRKEDFEEDQTCTIKGVKLEEMQTSGETRWVLYFREHSKAMVLNTTAIRVLEAAYGDDSDHWVGKPVTVYVDPSVSFQGRVVGGLRLKPVVQRKAKPTTGTMNTSPKSAHLSEADKYFDDKVDEYFNDNLPADM
jgi:hypothetical protein